MKRILCIVIPKYIGIIIGLIFFGKFVFGKYDYHISENQSFAIYKDEVNPRPNDRILKVYNGGVLVEEVRHINTNQIPRLKKDRIVSIHKYDTDCGPIWVFFYVITVFACIIYLITHITFLHCYFSDNYCYGYTHKCELKECPNRFRCRVYDKIENYNLNPYKKSFKLFWNCRN